MLGSEIAENLRQNRERWCRHVYHFAGQYCVIGLKLHELGVPVETWDIEQREEMVSPLIGDRMTYSERMLLQQLQNVNDESIEVDSLIAYCEKNASVDYPLERLAELLKEEV